MTQKPSKKPGILTTTKTVFDEFFEKFADHEKRITALESANKSVIAAMEPNQTTTVEKETTK